MSEAHFQPVSDLLPVWREGIINSVPPKLYRVADDEALGSIEIVPELVTLFGGAPGAGKTALVMQMIVEALQRNALLRALVCNVEMSPTVLLDRQLARLSGIDLTTIRYRRLDEEHQEQLQRGLSALESLGDRLAFVQPPYDLDNVVASADAFKADLIVLDYIQRIGSHGTHIDRRGAVDSTMGHLRQFSDHGYAFVVVAALARSKDSRGRSSYGEGLNLASFRETSELEYGADDAFILTAVGNDQGESPSRVVLKHLKSRHGETRDITLNFDRKHQSFTSAEPAPHTKNTSKKRQALPKQLQDVWKGTPAASDDGDES